jgi:hypothetical protein
MSTFCTRRARVRTLTDENDGLTIDVTQQGLILGEIRKLHNRSEVRSG